MEVQRESSQGLPFAPDTCCEKWESPFGAMVDVGPAFKKGSSEKRSIFSTTHHVGWTKRNLFKQKRSRIFAIAV